MTLEEYRKYLAEMVKAFKKEADEATNPIDIVRETAFLTAFEHAYITLANVNEKDA